MLIQQKKWTPETGWTTCHNSDNISPQIVMYFASPDLGNSAGVFAEIRDMYPGAEIVGCSTGGEIVSDEAVDSSVISTAIEFSKTRVRTASYQIENSDQSYDAGNVIARELSDPTLTAIFILSDGIHVNGSMLVKGITDKVGENVSVTGGLAGDADRFGATFVALNDIPRQGQVAAVGFYGDSLIVGHGSMGGWNVFGPERRITRACGNVLYELDGEPALSLYKRYLGPEAEHLPSSALHFPLKVRPKDQSDHDIVRTIVGVNEDEQSMIFAGNIPEGDVAQLMHGNFDHLVEGAASAAQQANQSCNVGKERVAFLVSCIGRKLLLGQRASEEIEAVADVLGENTVQAGFYSYGEISPHARSGMCELHNQTMTVTVLSES